MERKDLRIQFRGIQYGNISHVLQYRIDPEDDRNGYIETKKYLFGLFKRDIPKKYSCNWITVRIFGGSLDFADEYNELNYKPIWIKNKDDVKFYKDRFNTIGQFEEYLDKKSDENYKRYKINRDAYLKRMQPIY